MSTTIRRNLNQQGVIVPDRTDNNRMKVILERSENGAVGALDLAGVHSNYRDLIDMDSESSMAYSNFALASLRLEEYEGDQEIKNQLKVYLEIAHRLAEKTYEPAMKEKREEMTLVSLNAQKSKAFSSLVLAYLAIDELNPMEELSDEFLGNMWNAWERAQNDADRSHDEIYEIGDRIRLAKASQACSNFLMVKSIHVRKHGW